MSISILQTKNWQAFQHDLNETTFFEENNDFTFLAIKKSTPVGPYLYVPYGPYTRTKNAPQKALKALQELAESIDAFAVRIEPQTPEIASYRLAAEKLHNSPKLQKSHDLNPKDTWVLDLTPDEDDLKHGFSQGTRTRFNQFPKKGLTVTTSKNPDDIDHLVRLQQKLAKTKKIGTFSPEYLKTELKQPFATLYLVHFEDPATKTDKILAASLFFDDAETRYYMQSAADKSPEYKKLPATVALLTTALFDAKKLGKKSFDFWGIAPEDPKTGKIDPKHPWAGFTEFKKSFGGSAKHYAGTYDLILKPGKYKAYQLLRKINRLQRKIFKK